MSKLDWLHYTYVQYTKAYDNGHTYSWSKRLKAFTYYKAYNGIKFCWRKIK